MLARVVVIFEPDMEVFDLERQALNHLLLVFGQRMYVVNYRDNDIG